MALIMAESIAGGYDGRCRGDTAALVLWRPSPGS